MIDCYKTKSHLENYDIAVNISIFFQLEIIVQFWNQKYLASKFDKHYPDFRFPYKSYLYIQIILILLLVPSTTI